MTEQEKLSVRQCTRARAHEYGHEWFVLDRQIAALTTKRNEARARYWREIEAVDAMGAAGIVSNH
jgi:hypothetical protein